MYLFASVIVFYLLIVVSWLVSNLLLVNFVLCFNLFWVCFFILLLVLS